jgi:hypothetical protein
MIWDGDKHKGSSTGVRHWRPWTFLIKGAALGIPWGIIEDALTRYEHPDLGYAIGIVVGLSCMYAVPPRDTALWRFLLIGAVGILLRLIMRH